MFDLFDRLLGEPDLNRAETTGLLAWVSEIGIQQAQEPTETSRVKDTKPSLALEKYAGRYAGRSARPAAGEVRGREADGDVQRAGRSTWTTGTTTRSGRRSARGCCRGADHVPARVGRAGGGECESCRMFAGDEMRAAAEANLPRSHAPRGNARGRRSASRAMRVGGDDDRPRPRGRSHAERGNEKIRPRRARLLPRVRLAVRRSRAGTAAAPAPFRSRRLASATAGSRRPLARTRTRFATCARSSHSEYATGVTSSVSSSDSSLPAEDHLRHARPRRRPRAPGPVAIGIIAATSITVVIRIGRSRVSFASRIASSRGMPLRPQHVRVVHLQDAVLLHDAEQHEQADHRVDVQRRPQQDQRQQRERDRQRHAPAGS